MFSKCKIKFLSDIDSGVVTKYLSNLKKKPTKNCQVPSEASARTKDTYRVAILSFCNWCTSQDPKRLATNPIQSTPKPDGPVVHERRAESVENLMKLLKAAEERQLVQAQKINRGKLKGTIGAKLSPETIEKLQNQGLGRKLVYTLAISTGMRYGEIKRLQVEDVTIDEGIAVVVVKGYHNRKNKKDFKLPIKNKLFNNLISWSKLNGLKTGEKLFKLPTKIDDVFEKDLEFAGLKKYCPLTNKYFVFHSLRHCTDSYLMNSGLPPSVVMLFMRHKKPEMTMVKYNDPRMANLPKALDALPELGD